MSVISFTETEGRSNHSFPKIFLTVVGLPIYGTATQSLDYQIKLKLFLNLSIIALWFEDAVTRTKVIDFPL